MTGACVKKLSVVVPVYNTEEQLPRCVGSLLPQMDDACELVLVDDGSSDLSGELCDVYGEDPKVTVLHQANKGVSAARNFGLEKASGEYIWFVDSDDWVPDGALRVVLDAIADSEIDLLCFAEDKVSVSGDVIGLLPAPYLGRGPKDGPLLLGDGLYPHSHVFRKSLCVDLRFDESLSLLEDRQFFYRLWLRVEKVVSVDAALYCYVVDRKDSAVNNQTIEKLLGAQRVAKEIYLSELGLGRSDSAYSSYVLFTLMALSKCGRESGLGYDFNRLRAELLSCSDGLESLSRELRLKYKLLKFSPRLFIFACRVKESL